MGNIYILPGERVMCMSAFNPMEGYTVAKNPWEGTRFANGTHYFKTAYPDIGHSDAQEQQRKEFTQARQQAEQQCSGKTGKARMECIASTMSDILS